MADNRMYIRCKGCGAHLFLAKRSIGTGWFGVKSAEQKGEELMAFIDEHEECCNHLDEAACDGVHPWSHEFEPFELDYEMRDDFGYRLCYQERQRLIDLGRSEDDVKVLQRIVVGKELATFTNDCWDKTEPLPIAVNTIAVNYSSGIGRFDEHPVEGELKHELGLIMELMSIVQRDKFKPVEGCPDLLEIQNVMWHNRLQWFDILSDGSACVWIKDSND